MITYLREHLLNEWHQGLLQDWGVHDPIESTNAGPATHTNASPYVNLDWMLCPVD